MSNKILLTGAGFSHNFGLPLTKSLWGKIFNQPEIKRNRLLNKIFHDEQNYEVGYQRIQSECTEEQLKTVNNVLTRVFSEIDEIAVQYISSSDKIDISKLKNFLSRFAYSKNDQNAIFTLNHDIFLERIFNKDIGNPSLKLPFIKELEVLDSAQHANTEITPYDHFKEISIDFSKETYNYDDWLTTIGDEKINMYLKLHGSCNWKETSERASDILIIGQDKINRIETNPLLKEYFEVFKKTLVDHTKVLTIGYSFNDDHINEILLNHNIEIQVINPTSSDVFYNQMNDTSLKKSIWDHKIKNYFEVDLQDLFPANTSKPKILNTIEKIFFEDN